MSRDMRDSKGWGITWEAAGNVGEIFGRGMREDLEEVLAELKASSLPQPNAATNDLEALLSYLNTVEPHIAERWWRISEVLHACGHAIENNYLDLGEAPGLVDLVKSYGEKR